MRPAPRRLIGIAAALAALSATASCRVEFGQREGGAVQGDAVVRVYSSMYKEVIDAVGPALAAELAKSSPGTKVEWFQSGSEKVAGKLDAELASGGSPCDILLTSDPLYYRRLKEEGRLVPYVSPAAIRQPRVLMDPGGYFATARVSTMVIGVSAALAAKNGGADVPRSFADLAKPGTRVTMGDPLSSGTFFTTVSVLSARAGWKYFEDLKKKGTIASGGNSNVLQRLETGEADAGMVLLENLLTSRGRGSKVVMVIPADGAVAIPGSIALLTHAKHSEAARAVYDALLSDPVQALIVEKGNMHSPDPGRAPPAGAPTLDSVLDPDPKAPAPADEVKANFDRIFFR